MKPVKIEDIPLNRWFSCLVYPHRGSSTNNKTVQWIGRFRDDRDHFIAFSRCVINNDYVVRSEMKDNAIFISNTGSRIVRSEMKDNATLIHKCNLRKDVRYFRLTEDEYLEHIVKDQI